MAAKRKRPRAPSTRSQFTAVLEAIERQNRVTIEAFDSTRVALERQISEFRREFNSRFDTLEAVVRDLVTG